MNYWKLTAIILATIAFLGLAFFGYNYVANSIYSEGYLYGQLSVVESITQTGNIPYYDNQTIKTIAIGELCKAK
jgi:hypothetical protein